MFNVLDFENYTDVIKYCVKMDAAYHSMLKSRDEETLFLNSLYFDEINELNGYVASSDNFIKNGFCTKEEHEKETQKIRDWNKKISKLESYKKYLGEIFLEEHKEQRSEFDLLFSYIESEYVSVNRVVMYVTEEVKKFGNHPDSFQIVFEQYKKQELEKRNNKAMTLEQK